MTFLLPLLARLGIPEPLRRAVGWAVAAIVLCGLLWAAWAIWLSNHDTEVIDQHEQTINTEVFGKTSDALAKAMKNDADRREATARADAQMKEALRHAEDEHPQESRAAVGPVSDAAIDRLRKRAAASGRPAD